MIFLPLPDDDEVLILRGEVYRYGGPRPATLAKWACRPSEAPIDLPYVMVGRCAAYRVGVLRRLRKVLTFHHSTERTVAAEQRKARREAV